MSPHPETSVTLDEYFARLRTDYPFFCDQLWKAMGWDKKAPIGMPEVGMMDYVASGPDECGVLAPRGIGKTHIVTIAFTLWSWLNDADTRVLVVSKSAEHAREVVQFCRKCLNTVPFLRHLKPRPGSKDAGHAFSLGPAGESKQPSIRAIGVDGQLEGNRAHIIIADDVETDDNALTVQSRAKLAERVNEFGAILYKPEESAPGATPIRRRIIYVGTYHHEFDSLYLKLDTRGVRFRTWPLCYPLANERTLNLAPEIAEALADNPALAGRCVFGHRLDDAYLAKEKARGRRYWSMQLMLLLPGKDGTLNRLNLSDFIVMDVDPQLAPPHVVWGTMDSSGSTALEDIPTMGLGDERLHRPAFIPQERIPYRTTVAFIDPAGSGADETAVAIVGVLGGLFHIKLVRGILTAQEFDGNSAKAVESIAKDLQRHGATRVVYESNIDPFGAYGAMLRNALTAAGHLCTVEAIHQSTRKEPRMFGVLHTLLSQRRLVIDRRSIVPDPHKPPEYQLQTQIARLTDERGCLIRDDRIDALAGALGTLDQDLADTPNDAASRDHTRHVEADIERLLARIDEQNNQRRPQPRFHDRGR